MKWLNTVCCFLLFPFLSFAQNVNGLWSGTLTNDSTGREQKFELALSEYKGNITGYSYTTFIANDSFYYSIKKIKASIKGNLLIVEDDEMISNNFPERAAKGVKQATILQVTSDSMNVLSGIWKTNRTKLYYSLTGTAQLVRENDSSHSALIAHLDEMESAKNRLPDYAEKKSMLAKAEPVKQEAKTKKPSDIPAVATRDVAANKTSKGNSDLSEKNENPTMDSKTNSTTSVNKTKKEEVSIQHTSDLNDVAATGFSKDSKTNNKSKTTNQQATVTNNNPVGSITQETIADNVSKNQKIAATESKMEKKSGNKDGAVVQNQQKTTEVVQTKNVQNNPTSNSQVGLMNNNKATRETLMAQRTTVSTQTIHFKSDSLSLSFYDNGIVDGDSISVYVNGKIIIDRERLTEKAMKRTVYITPDMPDSIQLVLFAENLGSIPPNTGLVIIRDGTDIYDVRFSADFTKNAAITFRRRK